MGSQGPVQHSTTQQGLPPSMQPFTNFGMQNSQAQYGQYSQPLPFSTVVPFSPATAQAQSGVMQYAGQGGAGSNLTNAGTSYAQSVLSGQQLSPDTNPWLADVVNRSVQASTGPVNALFAGSGRGGSGLAANAIADAAQGTASNIYNQNYQFGRGQQMQALSALPQTFQAGLAPQEAQAGVGAQQEAKSGQYIQQQLQNYYMPQTALNMLGQQEAGWSSPYRESNTTSYSEQPFNWTSMLSGIMNPMGSMMGGGGGGGM